MKLLMVGLKGRKREKLFFAESPEEFFRMYDGCDNPIGKAYTFQELRRMLSKFLKIKFSFDYIPWKAIPLKIGISIRKFLSNKIGLLVLAKLRK